MTRFEGEFVMKEADKVFAGSVPALYDRYLGPMIFEPYALDLAERVGAIGAKRILETAAGTGIVSRAMSRRLSGDCAILATDLNQPMLDHAVSQTKAVNVTYGQADAQALPFDDCAFDAVVCQFGFMFFPAKPAALAAARRVLKAGGKFIFNVWDRLEANEFPHVIVEALNALYPDNPPKFLSRTPYGFNDKTVLEKLLREAGFSHVEIETIAKTSRAPSPRDPAIGFCQGSPLRGELEAMGAGQLEKATDAAAAAIARRFGEGPIEGRIQAIVVSADR
jgi:ubiquinone/menaquinone biosynthesis C-methylase UbiE